MAFEALARLKRSLGNILHNATSGELEEKYCGRIADEHVLVRDGGGNLVAQQPGPEFQSNKTYLQVVINHMFVKQDRALWVEREHLGAVWMGVRYAGSPQSVPFMVGRDLLVDKVRDLPPGARIEFQDVRVGQLYPYTGDGLSLYLGLWSTPTVDWASTVFSALDTIAGKIKVAPSLSQVLDMVDVLNQGISTVLGLNKIQAHLNLYQEFQDPTGGGASVLRPGYFVMLDVPKATYDPSPLRVVDGRLCTLTANGTPTPYYENDFLLYSITCQKTLSTAVDMWDQQYSDVLTALIGSKAEPSRLALAAQAYHTLQTRIVTSPDLTRDDRLGLLSYFGDCLNTDAVRLAVDLKSSGVSFAAGQRPRLPRGLPRPSQTEFERVRERLADIDPEPEAAVLAGSLSTRFQEVLASTTAAAV